ncbi:MAG: NUDIX hydrolase [Deltaproteobacteria bacterium]|nr:NUDIX hydrolase [Deltaproteobacteria bacterium]
MSSFRRAGTETLFSCSWLTLSAHSLEDAARNPVAHRVYTVDMADWVNVLALTPARELVLVRQHRFGIEGDSLEIPGGLLDPNEDALDAAKRELREETGFESDRWESFGWSHPNPALQGNRLHTFVAHNAVERHALSLDPLEDCRVERLPLADLPRALRQGQIRHALVLVALYELLLAEHGVPVHTHASIDPIHRTEPTV